MECLCEAVRRPPFGGRRIDRHVELFRVTFEFENLKFETQSSKVQKCFVVVSFPGPLLLPNKYSYLLTILPL